MGSDVATDDWPPSFLTESGFPPRYVSERDAEPPARGWRRLLPRSWRGARFDPGRPGATALALVAAAAALLAAVGVWSNRPHAEPVSGLPVVAAAATGAPAPTAATTPPVAPPAMLVLSVSGKVLSPGLVRVPDGARVADAITAAGGMLPGTDLLGLNPARRVGDGEQIVVGAPPPPEAPAASSGADPVVPAAPAAPAAKVDLNTAGVSQLDALPGVGPVTAQRIVEWRTRNGRFARVDQLREIEGIGERKLGQLRDLVRV